MCVRISKKLTCQNFLPVIGLIYLDSFCLDSDMYEGTRDAQTNDVAGIEQLLRPLVEGGVVVDRPRQQVIAAILYYLGRKYNELFASKNNVKSEILVCL